MSTLLVPTSRVPLRSRPVRHLAARYVRDRARQALYERAHPNDPWLTPAAIRLLTSLLRPTDRGAEFGSGRSTLWFATRVAALTSVEHDPSWHEAISARLLERGLRNVDYTLALEDQPMERGGDSAYARVACGLGDDSLDFALIDGHYRDYSAKFTLPKIRPGGMLIIDNVNWYLPSQSKSPHSRTPVRGPKTPVWSEVAAELASWRSIWTSSGVWDTAIYIKPAPIGPDTALFGPDIVADEMPTARLRRSP